MLKRLKNKKKKWKDFLKSIWIKLEIWIIWKICSINIITKKSNIIRKF